MYRPAFLAFYTAKTIRKINRYLRFVAVPTTLRENSTLEPVFQLWRWWVGRRAHKELFAAEDFRFRVEGFFLFVPSTYSQFTILRSFTNLCSPSVQRNSRSSLNAYPNLGFTYCLYAVHFVGAWRNSSRFIKPTNEVLPVLKLAITQDAAALVDATPISDLFCLESRLCSVLSGPFCLICRESATNCAFVTATRGQGRTGGNN